MESSGLDNRRSSVTVNRQLSTQSGHLLSNGDANGRFSPNMRRPLGVAAMDVTLVLSGDHDYEEEKQHCVTFFPYVSHLISPIIDALIYQFF